VFWLTVSEVSVCDWLAPLLWARQKHHGGEGIESRAAHIVAGRKQRNKGTGPGVSFQGMPQ
jgi:hypothetical protein